MPQPELIAPAATAPRARVSEPRADDVAGRDDFADLIAAADTEAATPAEADASPKAPTQATEATAVDAKPEIASDATPDANILAALLTLQPAAPAQQPVAPAAPRTLQADATPESDAVEASAPLAAPAIAADTPAPAIAAPIAAAQAETAPPQLAGAPGAKPIETANAAAPVADAGPGARRAETGDAAPTSSNTAATPTGEAKPAQAQAAAQGAQIAQPQTGGDAAQANTIATPAGAAPAANAAVTASTEAAVRPQADAHPALRNAPEAAVQVYTRMIDRMDGRAQRFEIRLDPAELGRVDVRIEIGADKRVHAILAVHDSAAMTDLVKGQKALEQALTDAGVDLAEGGVSFQLSTDTGRGFGAQREAQADTANAWRNGGRVVALPDSADLAQATRPAAYGRSRLNLVA